MKKQLFITFIIHFISSSAHAAQSPAPTLKEQLSTRRKEFQKGNNQQNRKSVLKPLSQPKEPIGKIVTDEEKQRKAIESLKKNLELTELSERESKRRSQETSMLNMHMEDAQEVLKILLQQQSKQKEGASLETLKEIQNQIDEYKKDIKGLNQRKQALTQEKEKNNLQYIPKIYLSQADLTIASQPEQRKKHMQHSSRQIPHSNRLPPPPNTNTWTIEKLQRKEDQAFKKLEKGVAKFKRGRREEIDLFEKDKKRVREDRKKIKEYIEEKKEQEEENLRIREEGIIVTEEYLRSKKECLRSTEKCLKSREEGIIVTEKYLKSREKGIRIREEIAASYRLIGIIIGTVIFAAICCKFLTGSSTPKKGTSSKSDENTSLKSV